MIAKVIVLLAEMRLRFRGLLTSWVAAILMVSATPTQSWAQSPSTVYCFPGQGSDYRIFDSLQFPANFQVKHIEYPIPQRGEKMDEFAKRLADQIDTTGSIYFLGVSLGGMLAQALADSLYPEKVVILSSAKGQCEIPLRYRFMRFIPIHRIVPAQLYKWGSYVAQPLVEPDRKRNKATFKAMLRDKNPLFLKRATHMIVGWKRETLYPKTLHIHGTNDHTIPIRRVKADYYVIGGSHMMTLTMGRELSPLLQKVLTP